MALCQLCGIELQQEVELADNDLSQKEIAEPVFDINAVWAARPEMKSLEQLNKMAVVKIMASRFMPNIALTETTSSPTLIVSTDTAIPLQGCSLLE